MTKILGCKTQRELLAKTYYHAYKMGIKPFADIASIPMISNDPVKVRAAIDALDLIRAEGI